MSYTQYGMQNWPISHTSLALNDCNDEKMWVPLMLQLKKKEIHFQITSTEKEITWLTGEYMRLKQIEHSRKSVWIVAISHLILRRFRIQGLSSLDFTLRQRIQSPLDFTMRRRNIQSLSPSMSSEDNFAIATVQSVETKRASEVCRDPRFICLFYGIKKNYIFLFS